jgi:hypothetical protein
VVAQAAHQAAVQRVQPGAHPAAPARPALYKTLWYYRYRIRIQVGEIMAQKYRKEFIKFIF